MRAFRSRRPTVTNSGGVPVIGTAGPQDSKSALTGVRDALAMLKQSGGRQPKGLTNEIKADWSRDLAILLSDAGCPLDETLKEIALLPPSVTAHGALASWGSMNEERRGAYLEWLETLDSERSSSQKAILIPGLLESSPITSIDLLCGLSLTNREVKDRLAFSLVSSFQKTHLLAGTVAKDESVLKVLSKLLQLSESPKASIMGKAGIIRLALNTLVNRGILGDARAEPILNLIANQLLNLPPNLKQEIQSELAGLSPELMSRFFPHKPGVAVPPVPSVTPDTTRALESGEAVGSHLDIGSSAESAPAAPSLAGPSGSSSPAGPSQSAESTPVDVNSLFQGRLTELITTLGDWTKLFQDVQSHIRCLEKYRTKLESDLKNSFMDQEDTSKALETERAARQAADRKILSLEEDLRRSISEHQLAQERADSLSVRLAALVQEETSLRAELNERETTFAKERSDLARRIQTSAERRLEEYRNRLASSLGDLFHGIPSRGSAVSPELGSTILVRLYEVIDFLKNQGIQIVTRRGDKQ